MVRIRSSIIPSMVRVQHPERKASTFSYRKKVKKLCSSESHLSIRWKSALIFPLVSEFRSSFHLFVCKFLLASVSEKRKWKCLSFFRVVYFQGTIHSHFPSSRALTNKTSTYRPTEHLQTSSRALTVRKLLLPQESSLSFFRVVHCISKVPSIPNYFLLAEHLQTRNQRNYRPEIIITSRK